MTRKIFALAMALTMAATMMAQTVQETVVTIGPLTAPAYTISFSKDAKMTQEALKMRLNEAGLKTKSTEGYLACLEQVFAEISDAPISLYTKVEEQGKKKNKVTVITVCAICPNLTIDQNTIKSNTVRFIESLPAYVDRYVAMQNLDAKNAEVNKAQKALKSAQSDLQGIEKDIQSDQDKIAKKQKKIADLNAEIKRCENDIKNLESSIDKRNKKKAEAEKKVNDAQEKLRALESEAGEIRQMTE